MNKMCFSILQELEKSGDIEVINNFSYADTFPITKTLKDILEPNIDEKYYLSDKILESFDTHKNRHKNRGNGFAFTPRTTDELCSCLSTKYGSRQTDTYLKEPQLTQVGNIYDNNHNSMAGRVYDIDGLSVTLSANGGGGGGGGGKTGLYLEPKICDSSVSINFEREKEDIINSDKEIYKAIAKSGFQDNKVGIKISPTLRAGTDSTYCLGEIKDYNICAMRGRNPENPTSRESGLNTVQMIEVNSKGTSNCLTSVQKDNLVLEDAQTNYRIRKLTPRECFRLQGFDDDIIIDKVSNTQAYKQAGNGMSVNILEMVLCSIFREIKDPRFKFSSDVNESIDEWI